MARPDRFTRAQAYAVWVLWLTYGAFYFCRTNSSVFVPGLEEEAGLTKQEIGLVLGSLKLAYGAGQLINGQLAERFSPRILLATGMLASAALNVLFGLGAGLYFYLFVWAANGYFQALGWSPCMRVAANWFQPAVRGRAIGIIGTGYSVTGGLTFVIAGLAADRFGWRGALYVPAALFTAVALYMLFALRERPSDPDPPGPDLPPARPPARDPWHVTFRLTVSNPRLWLLALALALIDASRYGFTDWGIRHLMEVQGGSVGNNALKYAILPVAGAVGAMSAGWVSDRVFGGRRIPAIAACALLLAGAGQLSDAAVTTSVLLSVMSLAIVGFAIAGAQTILVGSAPIDLARGGKPAAAVGFVNMWGYLGAFTQDQITPFLVERAGWSVAVGFWSASAAAAALVLLPIWRVRADGS
jgi:sugar phosphate permease